jgi:glucose-6-phosphate 1-dehydrogenase
VYNKYSVRTKLLIFGITGDLSRRKLLPALQEIYNTGDFNNLSIIGVSRGDVDVSSLLQESVGEDSMVDRITIETMNLADKDDYGRLYKNINLQADEQLIVYLSVPPLAATQIVDFLGEAGINTPNVKILFEKPFGVDLDSAKEVIARTARYFAEDQLYRIDHYLAKEMAQNLIALRGRNALFDNIWNNNFIEKIEIIATEDIGIEGRAQFYEQTGALRDVLQGHLMQLLALTLMDIPTDFNWDTLPELRLDAINQIQPVNPAKVTRAQYGGYQEEVGNIGSTTETFVSLELESTQPRWLDVPILLTAGKGLDKKTTEIRIHLKRMHESQSNCIIFRIQPNEGIDIELFNKAPGYEREFETRHLQLNFDSSKKLPDAYEQVLVDAIRSRKSLFTSSDEVLRSWEILQPVQDSWNMSKSPLALYDRGASPDDFIDY